MDIKEAVKFLEGQREGKDEVVPPYRLGVNLIINEIIELLQCGKKYREMWGEFKKEYSDDSLTTSDNVGYVTHRVENFMDEFQQKYFPKPKPTREKINDIMNKVIDAKLLTKERDDIIALLVSLRDTLVKGGDSQC